MENKVYYTLSDGTVIDDEYVNDTVEKFDEAIRTGKASIEPNPHYFEPLRVKFSSMPKHLRNELEPFILNIEC